MLTRLPPPLAALAAAQAGALSRRQLAEHGVRDHLLQSLVGTGRWQLPHRGTYVTTSGPLPRDAVLWAALLACGSGAVLSHRTAAELHGLYDGASSPVHVTLPVSRRVRPPQGVQVHYALHLDHKRHASLRPPRTTVEETVLDLLDVADRSQDAVDVITRACQRRRTTPARLGEAAALRKKLRWRALVDDLLADVADGAESALEVRYLHDVERRHGLPRAQRQAVSRWGRLRRRDVLYRDQRVVVELDGAAAHPVELLHRDLERDTLHAVHEGALTLRFGWHAVVGDPCRVADQVTQALVRQGWTGRPRPCSPECTAGRPLLR